MCVCVRELWEALTGNLLSNIKRAACALFFFISEAGRKDTLNLSVQIEAELRGSHTVSACWSEHTHEAFSLRST